MMMDSRGDTLLAQDVPFPAIPPALPDNAARYAGEVT